MTNLKTAIFDQEASNLVFVNNINSSRHWCSIWTEITKEKHNIVTRSRGISALTRQEMSAWNECHMLGSDMTELISLRRYSQGYCSLPQSLYSLWRKTKYARNISFVLSLLWKFNAYKLVWYQIFEFPSILLSNDFPTFTKYLFLWLHEFFSILFFTLICHMATVTLRWKKFLFRWEKFFNDLLYRHQWRTHLPSQRNVSSYYQFLNDSPRNYRFRNSSRK